MKTADLMDIFQEELQSCELQFRNYGGRKAFWGRCRTLKCQNDNVILKRMLGEEGGGAVLVVDGGGSLGSALMGDILGEMARKHNWAGTVINGAVRDTVALGELALGVKALGSNPRRSEKNGAGQSDVPVSFGEITVKPGDWIYCDEDGVVVANRELPLDQAQEIPH